MLKLKTWFIKLFFRKEISEFEAKMKQAIDAKRQAGIDTFKKEAAALKPKERELMEQYAKMQGEVFKAFMVFIQELQKTNGHEMDGMAAIWQSTTIGLNKTIETAFKQKNDAQIKAFLAEVQKELQIAIDTNQEVIANKVPNSGGFGYSGPIGEA